jgi:hypothetical protein
MRFPRRPRARAIRSAGRSALREGQGVARLRHFAKIASWLAVTGVLLGSLAGFGAAGAATAGPTVTTRPTVHEQQALNQNIPIATGNVHTTAITSPVLAEGNYLVNMAMGVYNLPAGAVVLCGVTTSTNGDVATGNYGQLENEGTTSSSGNCVVTGTIKINNPNDQIIAWVTVYTGPGGPEIGDTSMNELPVGTVVLTH